MSNFDLTTLNVGDRCGINESVPSCARRRVVAATVVKTSKTTVTVTRDALDSGKTWTFNISNGLERGVTTSEYHTDRLVSAETLDWNRAQAKMDAAKDSTAQRRVNVLERMKSAANNDKAFAKLLEELNQKEYAL